MQRKMYWFEGLLALGTTLSRKKEAVPFYRQRFINNAPPYWIFCITEKSKTLTLCFTQWLLPFWRDCITMADPVHHHPFLLFVKQSKLLSQIFISYWNISNNTKIYTYSLQNSSIPPTRFMALPWIHLGLQNSPQRFTPPPPTPPLSVHKFLDPPLCYVFLLNVLMRETKYPLVILCILVLCICATECCKYCNQEM